MNVYKKAINELVEYFWARSLTALLVRKNIEDGVVAYKKSNSKYSFLVQYAKHDSSGMNSLCDIAWK